MMAMMVYRCPECGASDGLYGRGDVRWNFSEQEWQSVEVEDLIDCTECDFQGPIALFEGEPE